MFYNLDELHDMTFEFFQTHVESLTGEEREAEAIEIENAIEVLGGRTAYLLARSTCMGKEGSHKNGMEYKKEIEEKLNLLF